MSPGRKPGFIRLSSAPVTNTTSAPRCRIRSAQLRDSILDAGSGLWLTVLGRAVARGEISPEALHPRVATVAIVLLRNEYVARGTTTVPDRVLVEIVDEIYLPLLRGRQAGLDPGR